MHLGYAKCLDSGKSGQGEVSRCQWELVIRLLDLPVESSIRTCYDAQN